MLLVNRFLVGLVHLRKTSTDIKVLFRGLGVVDENLVRKFHFDGALGILLGPRKAVLHFHLEVHLGVLGGRLGFFHLLGDIRNSQIFLGGGSLLDGSSALAFATDIT